MGREEDGKPTDSFQLLRAGDEELGNAWHVISLNLRANSSAAARQKREPTDGCAIFSTACMHLTVCSQRCGLECHDGGKVYLDTVMRAFTHCPARSDCVSAWGLREDTTWVI
jgi:hypothetical protein